MPALLDETTLASLTCFCLEVLGWLTGFGVPLLFGGGGGGTPDLRVGVFLVGVEFEVVTLLEETVDRMEVLDGVRRGATGASFLLSTGEGGGRLEVVDAFDTIDGARERTTLGDDTDVVAVDLADLTEVVDIVEAVDITLDRVAADVGVSSDLAVSNAVETSLADSVEFGRDRADGGRRVEGPAPVFRMVDAVDRVDLTEAADERLAASLVEAMDCASRRGIGPGFDDPASDSMRVERAELAT